MPTDTFKTMISISKTSYPLSMKRFSILRSFCIEHLKTFYSLRHTALTYYTIAILQNSQLSLHKRNQTTLERYIDMELCANVSKVFQIKQLCSESQHLCLRTSQKMLVIGQKETEWVDHNEKEIFSISKNLNDEIEDETEDAALEGSIEIEKLPIQIAQ